MGRPPCCDKEGIKKGPWTPEEDIILVSYIQQHGPSNWRSVPMNTGLLRCSKSCRLRWTNYLRPGIKRGNFTPQEEGIIIHLQALLGNKWAAIASYLPQRTDNDIKNYWNTHLKKKLNKLQSALGPHSINVASSPPLSADSSSRSFSTERSSVPGTSQPASGGGGGGGYASSADNISRLLETWMRPSAKTNHKNSRPDQGNISCFNIYHPKTEQECVNLMSREEFDSMLSFDNINDVTWDKSSCDSGSKDSGNTDNYDEEKEADKVLDTPRSLESPQLSVLDKWLFDESSGQIMELDPIL